MREAVHRIQLPYLFTGYQDIKIRKDDTMICAIFFLFKEPNGSFFNASSFMLINEKKRKE